MTFSLTDVYIERCDKETEEVIAKEDHSYLKQPLSVLKQHRNEFLYIESPSFDQLKIDSISLELDDVFETYTALLGLKVQKKHGATITSFLNQQLHGDNVKFSAMFSGEDGLWDLNIPIDFMEGFQEDLSLEETLSLVHKILLDLVHEVENNSN